MNITQKDIAAAANVSQALVSLVLSEKTAGPATANKALRVSPETRQRILETAERLGYRRKSLRCAPPEKSFLYLRRLKRDQAAAPSPWMPLAEEARHQALQNALIEAASQEGAMLNLRLYHQPDEAIAAASGYPVDGIFLGSADAEILRALAPEIPVVVLEEKPPVACDRVVPDHHDLLEKAVEHLRRHGHTRIALLSAHPGAGVAVLRRLAMAELTERWELQPGLAEPEHSDAAAYLDHLFASAPSPALRPTALIAEEPLALSLLNEAVRRGLSLPEDLSLVGLGHSPASAFSLPPLTTVEVSPLEITRAALSLMAERLASRGRSFAFRKVEVAARLTVRGSVAALKSTLKTPSKR